MTVSQLPRDLVEEEILCRIPATYLKGLRSTCKRWNSLFKDKRFVRNHFDKAAKQFFVLMLTKEFKIFALSINLHGIISTDFKGELSLLDSPSCHNSAQLDISQVFHYDGLLLCTMREDTRIVVWNPCTGQTKWINQPIKPHKLCDTYTLGSYRESNSPNDSYKILRHGLYGDTDKFEICEINSNLWRILDANPDFQLFFTNSSVSLNGKTYWFALDEKERHLGMFLVSFDYTTERFGRLCLPCECFPVDCGETAALSVVREEKLSVLLRRRETSKTEIWVTNEIDETRAVSSWSKILVADYPRVDISIRTSFVVDEGKKVAVCFERWMEFEDVTKSYDLVNIVGEDNKVTQVYYGASTMTSCRWPRLCNYVPSLVQIT